MTPTHAGSPTLTLLAFVESDGVPVSSWDFCSGGCLFFAVVGVVVAFFAWLGWKRSGRG